MMLTKEEQLCEAVAYRYELTVSDIDAEDNLRYTAYGVKALDGNRHVVAHYPDVSTNKELVSRIVEAINHGQLDVLHLRDVIWDFLG